MLIRRIFNKFGDAVRQLPFLTNFNDRKYLRDDKNIAKIAKGAVREDSSLFLFTFVNFVNL